MYKSSSLTFFYKYLFTPIWGGGFVFGILSSWNAEDEFIHHWSRAVAPMVVWALVWLVILMIRLRNVEAHRDHLLIKSLHGNKVVSYKDIEYVSEYVMISPRLISIKYRNNSAGVSESILIMPPSEFTFKVFNESEMTKFIREQIVKHNSFYSTDREPSRWSAARLIFATGIPIMLYANYLMYEAMTF